MTSRARTSTLFLLASLVALPAAGCTGDEESDHGYVKVQLRRAESESESPFSGTTEVQLQFNYSMCLDMFYESNPNWAEDGLDGAPVFAEFEDDSSGKGLCQQKDSSRVPADCETLDIEQDLTGDVGILKARYRITDNDMEDKILFFGPLPCESLTVCEPLISAFGNSGTGYGNGGTKIWGTTSFPQRDGACGQGLPIELSISR